jgi:hypothetical protein
MAKTIRLLYNDEQNCLHKEYEDLPLNESAGWYVIAENLSEFEWYQLSMLLDTLISHDCNPQVIRELAWSYMISTKRYLLD